MLEKAAGEVDRVAAAWRERAARDQVSSSRTRALGLAMVLLAVLASVASQLEASFASSSIRTLSRGAVQAESANDAWQHYSSRRIKEDLFDMHRARLAREVRELTLEGRGQGEFAKKLHARIHELEELEKRYASERIQNFEKARRLEEQSQASAAEGFAIAERGWFVKRGAGAFQIGIALFALAFVLRSRVLSGLGVLAGMSGAALAVYGLAVL